MKKYFVMALASLLVIATLLAGCAKPAPVPAPKPAPAPAPAPKETVYKWRMQSVDPPGIPSYKAQAEFCNWVRDASNGRLDITLYSGGELIKTSEIVDALARGTIEISYTSNINYQGLIPEANLTMTLAIPMLLRTYGEEAVFYHVLGVDELIREAFAERGVYFLQTLIVDGNTIWSKKPMRSVADLKGFKVRSFAYVAKTLAALGASPVSLPHEEVYTALATGVIDGSGTGISYYGSLKYYELCPYFYMPYMVDPSTMEMMASMSAWNKLPNDLKAILAHSVSDFAIYRYERVHREQIDMFGNFPKWGTTIIRWSDEDIRKITETGMTFIPEIAAKSPRNAKAVNILTSLLKTLGYIK